MSAQSTEHGTGPEEQIKAPELSIVPNIPETLTSSYDPEQTMEVILPGNTEAAKALVDWNREVLPMAPSSTDVAHLIDDAFKQELLRYETTEGKGGQSKTEVIGMVPEAVQWYNEARKAQEALKVSEKTTAQTRIDEARAQAKSASTPPETRLPNTAETHESAIAEKKARSTAQGLETRRVNQEAKIAEKQAGYLPNTDETRDLAIAEKKSRSTAQGLETRRRNAEAKAAMAAVEPVVEVLERPREEEPDTYVKSREQSHEAALAMQPDTDTRLEVQAQDAELQTAAERLREKLGIDIPLNLSTKIEALTTSADKAGELAIKAYTENLGKTLEASLDRTSEGMVKNTLKGEQLNMVEDLRVALGVAIEPLFLDSDKKSFTQYFKSDLDKDILLAERYDRESGRLVEASVIRGEDLVKTNKKGEAEASKTLKAEMIKTQTETSYANPTEDASAQIRNATGDIGMAGAIMRRRGASGVESASMERSKKVKRREPWWTGLFSGGGN
ncbi:MAG: hypothetical protein ABIS59_02910 [Candidatus Saccharibacteria bacterium]